MTASFEIGLLLAGVLVSLFVFSLIFGDNWLFRFASMLLAGALGGYICVFLVERVFIPQIFAQLADPNAAIAEKITAILAIAAILFLVIKFSSSFPRGGDIILVILFCFSAAILILGTVNGTLLSFYTGLVGRFEIGTMSESEKNSVFHWAESLIVLICAILSMLYTRHFSLIRKKASAQHHESKKTGLTDSLGEIVVGFSLGAICAGCFIASASILVSHLSEIIQSISYLLK